MFISFPKYQMDYTTFTFIVCLASYDRCPGFFHMPMYFIALSASFSYTAASVLGKLDTALVEQQQL